MSGHMSLQITEEFLKLFCFFFPKTFEIMSWLYAIFHMYLLGNLQLGKATLAEKIAKNSQKYYNVK